MGALLSTPFKASRRILLIDAADAGV